MSSYKIIHIEKQFSFQIPSHLPSQLIFPVIFGFIPLKSFASISRLKQYCNWSVSEMPVKITLAFVLIQVSLSNDFQL